ncbi:MAG: hypothetical protein R2879_05960 [Saprospiraceae bacterium]
MKNDSFQNELKSMLIDFKSRTEAAILKNNQEILNELDFKERLCRSFQESYLNDIIEFTNEQFEGFKLPFRAFLMESFSKSIKGVVKNAKAKPPVKILPPNIIFEFHLKIFNSSITEGKTPLATLIICPDLDKVTLKGPNSNDKQVINLPKKDFDQLINGKVLELIRAVLKTN